MNVTITVNIGLTDQLAGFLTKLVGASASQHESETTGAARPAPKPVSAEPAKAADPFGAPAPSAEPDSTTSGSATDASAASAEGKPSRRKSSKPADAGSPAPADPFGGQPSTGAAALGVGDAFSQQVRAAGAAETEDSGAPAYTVKDLNDAAAAHMAVHKASGVKAILEANFKAADGSPVDRLSAVQAQDYAAAIAKLREGI